MSAQSNCINVSILSVCVTCMLLYSQARIKNGLKLLVTIENALKVISSLSRVHFKNGTSMIWAPPQAVWHIDPKTGKSSAKAVASYTGPKGPRTTKSTLKNAKFVGETRWFEKKWGTHRFEAALFSAWWNPQPAFAHRLDRLMTRLVKKKMAAVMSHQHRKSFKYKQGGGMPCIAIHIRR